MMKAEPSECSARLAELSRAVVVADLPASDEPRQPMDTTDADTEPEAPTPMDSSNTDLFHEMPDLDVTSPELGLHSDHINFPVSLSCASSLFA